MPGPLSHLTVVELAGIGPGPFACMVLADLGAAVIRIDRPPQPPATEGLGKIMRNDGLVDRGRRSIALDLKQSAAVDVALRLIEQADVLVEGFRPGVAEKLGLGPQACHARNPRLVYGRMTGWGQHGPLSQAAGHDINYIALTGALHAIGTRDKPVPPLNLVGDYGGGAMLLLVGILAAYAQAQHSGTGQVVDAAMTDGAALLMAPQYDMLAKGAWRDERESNFLDGSAPFYGTYECADGKHVAIGPIEPQFHRKLVALCGLDEAEFDGQWDEARWPAQRTKLEAVFRSRDRAHWCELLEGSDACFAPVLSMTEAPTHPHNVARGTFVTDHGKVQPAPAPRFDRTPTQLPPRAPEQGAHTRELLARAGLGDAQVGDLLRSGVAFEATTTTGAA